MWRLNISEGAGAWLLTVSNFHGRQVWEFDPDAGTDQERTKHLRREFSENRFRRRESQDLLMRMQTSAQGPRLRGGVSCSCPPALSPRCEVPTPRNPPARRRGNVLTLTATPRRPACCQRGNYVLAIYCLGLVAPSPYGIGRSLPSRSNCLLQSPSC
ncbi:hypothetical protein C2845_PM10G11470 [Panicum miliaceum]|uniref:Uncharacterized protein n=1 Tax=Panicum miliaceum TaxID=4540 RepID=A0A3L6P9X7_PANMI|nr:hypothetical protein C2845_PM10G11470 [Panicum miliaceum]